jgi:hypothetical protein
MGTTRSFSWMKGNARECDSICRALRLELAINWLSLNSNIFKDLVFMPSEMYIPQSAGAKTAKMTLLASIYSR